MLKSYIVTKAHYYSYPGLFLQLIIYVPKSFCTCDSVYSSGIEQHKRADINSAAVIAEKPIVYTKLADAVNKKLRSDWDTGSWAKMSRANLHSVKIYIWLETCFTNKKAINLFLQSLNRGVFGHRMGHNKHFLIMDLRCIVTIGFERVS